MAIVLCCYCTIRDETLECLHKYAPEAVIKEIDPQDPFQYWREIAAFWEDEDDLIIIEPDMVFDQEQIDSLKNCPEPWCVYGYNIGGARTNFSLGFTKFSRRLRSVLKGALPACAYCYGAWFHLDVHTSDAFREAGFEPHDHGDVEHLHEYAQGIPVMHIDEWKGAVPSKKQITDYLKSEGWKGPGVYEQQDHKHIPGGGCTCIWQD